MIIDYNQFESGTLLASSDANKFLYLAEVHFIQIELIKLS